MAFNQPSIDEETGEDIIGNNLCLLVRKINQEGFDIDISDINYELFNRCEFIGIPSEKLYPNENLPSKFGVHRGYGGGGLHTGLIKTEIYNMKKSRQAKAGRLLTLFEKTFWQILKDTDGAGEKATGEKLEFWEKLSI